MIMNDLACLILNKYLFILRSLLNRIYNISQKDCFYYRYIINEIMEFFEI